MRHTKHFAKWIAFVIGKGDVDAHVIANVVNDSVIAENFPDLFVGWIRAVELSGCSFIVDSDR